VSPCAPSSPGGSDTYYDGWFGFDSIPVLRKSNPAVQQYFIGAGDSVTTHWLRQGASGWRLDVMGDPSFPGGYWESFRQTVKQTDPDAVIVGELWQKDSTLLRGLRGDLDQRGERLVRVDHRQPGGRHLLVEGSLESDRGVQGLAHAGHSTATAGDDVHPACRTRTASQNGRPAPVSTRRCPSPPDVAGYASQCPPGPAG